MTDVRMLSKPLAYEFPDEWYGLATEQHFWLAWRLAAFLNQLRTLGVPLSAPWKGLDIGCGHGLVRRQVEQHTQWELDGADLNEVALRGTLARRGANLFYDIHDRRPELRGAYDCLLLFDVIEHIEDSRRFLDSALFHLRPGGWLFVNVPAQERFRSAYDRVAGHVRRYDRPMMMRELAAHSLDVRDVRYWGLSLVPLAVLRKAADVRSGRSPHEILRAGFEPPAAWINSVLTLIMRVETTLLPSPPIGTSLLAAAVKR